MRTLLAVFIVVFGFIGPAAARDSVPFDAAAFKAAQEAGKPILVEIYASWCPTCAKQKPILSQLRGDAAFKDLVSFVIDFDSQKDLVRRFGARMQSTLIVYHGNREAGRSVGVTNADAIKALVQKAYAG